MLLPILTPSSNKLRQKAEDIKEIDQSILNLAKNMAETKRANFGVGLAANQIGELKRLIVIGSLDIPLTTMVNPKISRFSKEKETQEESCLSLPCITGSVSRPKEIIVKGLALNGKKIKLEASGLFARIIQHEIDHLDGILFTDRVEDIRTLKKVPLPYKIVFMGTPEFSVSILESLIKNNWGISLVITEADKPIGRKQILTLPPVKKIASKYNLLVRQPERIENCKPEVENLKPDLIVLAAYGQIVSQALLNIPKYGALCIHPSLLPKYRGSSPIQEVILNGDKETGTTIFKMDAKVDHGAIIKMSKLKTQMSKLNTEELSKKLSKLAGTLLVETLPLYLEGKIKPKPQNDKEATYTHLIKKEDGFVEKSEFRTKNKEQLERIERKIRAFYPWPKVWTKINGKRIIIHKAHIENSKLILDIIQPEGKKPMRYDEYLKGNPSIT